MKEVCRRDGGDEVVRVDCEVHYCAWSRATARECVCGGGLPRPQPIGVNAGVGASHRGGNRVSQLLVATLAKPRLNEPHTEMHSGPTFHSVEVCHNSDWRK
jgi:hypothetical protein